MDTLLLLLTFRSCGPGWALVDGIRGAYEDEQIISIISVDGEGIEGARGTLTSPLTFTICLVKALLIPRFLPLIPLFSLSLFFFLPPNWEQKFPDPKVASQIRVIT